MVPRSENSKNFLLFATHDNHAVDKTFMLNFFVAGHIAQAEKRLHDVLGSVDVVVEVRDARIPASTAHPMVDDWLRNRNAQRVVAITKIDLAPK